MAAAINLWHLFQELMRSAYLDQHSSTAVWSGVTGQSQISTSAASYPCGFAWDITGSTEKKSSSLGDFTETVTDQNTAMSMGAQYATPPGMLMVLKEIQPTDNLPPASTSGIDYTASATPITQPQFQDKNKEQKENNDLEDTKTKLSKPLDSSQKPTENQDDALLPLQIPDIHQLLACIDPLGQEKKPGSGNTPLEKNSMSLEGQQTTGHETQSSGSFAKVAAVVGDRHLPQLLSAFKDLDQFNGAEVMKAKGNRAIELNQVRESPHTKKGSSGQAKNKHKASERLSGAPKAKIQAKDPSVLLGGDMSIHSVADGECSCDHVQAC
ncbi:hypothetical protein MUG91_G222n70 [Manis pentadactyla]|nr:hypothetical protein MUG91_G222n70 [Manis pentadactyla]